MNKTIYDYSQSLILFVGIFVACDGILPVDEAITAYRIALIVVGVILVGYGSAKFRVPLFRIEDDGIELLYGDYRKMSYDEIGSCIYSNISGRFFFKLKDGTEIKRNLPVMLSLSQPQKIIDEINALCRSREKPPVSKNNAKP